MTERHLTPDELRRWRDYGDGDERQLVVTHLAVCDTCGHRLAELVRELPATAVPARFREEDFKPRGHAAFMPKPGHGPRRTPIPLALAAAATVTLVAGAFVVIRSPDPPVEPIVRGTAAELSLVAPIGDVGDRQTLAFEWNGSGTSGPFRLLVFDITAPVTPIIDRRVHESRYEPSAEERARLAPGVRYRWFVEYPTASGGVAVSPAAVFAVSS